MHRFRWQGGTDPPNQNPADALADTSYSRVLFTFDRPTYRLLDARTPCLHDPGLESRRPYYCCCCCCIAGQCVIAVAVNHSVISILDYLLARCHSFTHRIDVAYCY